MRPLSIATVSPNPVILLLRYLSTCLAAHVDAGPFQWVSPALILFFYTADTLLLYPPPAPMAHAQHQQHCLLNAKFPW